MHSNRLSSTATANTGPGFVRGTSLSPSEKCGIQLQSSRAYLHLLALISWTLQTPCITLQGSAHLMNELRRLFHQFTHSGWSYKKEPLSLPDFFHALDQDLK